MEAGRVWQRAASFAARAHAGQVRKDNCTPYFAHPVRVALIVTEVFGCRDEVALAAALLHDTIEDTKTDYDDLAAAFGKDVAACVAALTKNMTMPEHPRERAYDAQLAKADWRARLVKLADQYDNYTEAASVGPGQVKNSAEKCRRALRLARVDVKARPETAKAVVALTALLRGSRRRR